MPTMQIVALVLGFVAAGYVFSQVWEPDTWWLDSLVAVIKTVVTFVCVAGAIWLVTLVASDRGSVGEEQVVADQPPTVTIAPEPTATTAPLPTATEPLPSVTQPPPTPTPTPTPTEILQAAGRTHLWLDVGDCAGDPEARAGECLGEQGATFVGWGSAKGPWSGMPFAPMGDATLRDMQLGGDNQIIIDDLAPLDFQLIAVTGDGACDDSFQILIGETLVYEYQANDPTAQTFEIHAVVVPASAIQGGRLMVTFRNTATDGCGLAGVFYVELRPA